MRNFTRIFFTFSAYIKASAALCVITLLTDLVATVLTGLGLRTKDHHTKFKYYRFAVIVMGLARKSSFVSDFKYERKCNDFFCSCVNFDSSYHISGVLCSRIKFR